MASRETIGLHVYSAVSTLKENILTACDPPWSVDECQLGFGVWLSEKTPTSLSGVFDSIGAPARCFEFIEFVIFGLGVKRAPVLWWSPPLTPLATSHSDSWCACPPLELLKLGENKPCLFYPSSCMYLMHRGNSWKEIYSVSVIKTSPGRLIEWPLRP